MQYLLEKEELDNLVPMNKYRDEKKKVEMLIKEYKRLGNCQNPSGNMYCDNCPISSLNNQFRLRICSYEAYSK